MLFFLGFFWCLLFTAGMSVYGLVDTAGQWIWLWSHIWGFVIFWVWVCGEKVLDWSCLYRSRKIQIRNIPPHLQWEVGLGARASLTHLPFALGIKGLQTSPQNLQSQGMKWVRGSLCPPLAPHSWVPQVSGHQVPALWPGDNTCASCDSHHVVWWIDFYLFPFGLVEAPGSLWKQSYLLKEYIFFCFELVAMTNN